MNSSYTILHISDLHKEKSSDYDNLYGSLCIDCEQYTSEGIGKPSIIVVSGDLVEGSKKEDIDEAEAEIKKQYDEVTTFLMKLADFFLDGDKSRIIIVPGNHDVCRAISGKSMLPETVNGTKEIRKKRDDMVKGSTRWSWDDLSFYSVNDHDQYLSRFNLFVEFYNSFYAGLRVWDFPCEETAQIIELPDYRVCFFALNSCHRLDHLNHMGSIYPNAISSSQRALLSMHNKGELLIGVWHHHTMGLPCENNYLDYRIIQSLISSHIKVGLYGHQHQTTLLNEYRDLTQNDRILLISSGSLYGGRSQLVTGCPRQYCLLVLDFHETDVDLTLHVRKDVSTTYEIPTWTTSQIGSSVETSHKETLQVKPFDIDRILSDIDDSVQMTRNFIHGAIDMRNFDDIAHDKVTSFIDSYLSNIADYEFIKTFVSSPQTETQFYSLWRASVETKDKDAIMRAMQSQYYQTAKGVMYNYLKEETSKILGI